MTLKRLMHSFTKARHARAVTMFVVMLHRLEEVKIVFYFLRPFNPIQYTIAIADDVAILVHSLPP